MLGVSCLYWLETTRESIWFILVLIIGLISANLYRRNPSVFLNSLLIGGVWGASAVILHLQTTPELSEYQKTSKISGFICSIPIIENSRPVQHNSQSSSTRMKFDFCLTNLNDKSIKFYQANKLRLTVYRANRFQVSNFQAGSFWAFESRLKPAHGRLNPGGFDYEKWMVSNGIIGSGYIKAASKLPKRFSILAYFHRVRQDLYNRLAHLNQDNISKPVILALAMGERGAIDPIQWNSFKESGTSHLLAISGLHIGIAAAWSYYLVFFIVRHLVWLSRKVPAQKVAYIASFAGAFSIALISGLGYPAQRALIMLAVFLYSKQIGRHLSPLDILFYSIFIILIVQPLSILTVSFWLSILSVLFIVLLVCYKRVAGKGIHKFKSWLRLNWYLFLGLAPLSWFVFDGGPSFTKDWY